MHISRILLAMRGGGGGGPTLGDIDGTMRWMPFDLITAAAAAVGGGNRYRDHLGDLAAVVPALYRSRCRCQG